MTNEERTINALRMGVIPARDLQSFMVGKEREKDELASFLETVAYGGSQVRFLRGAYGSGKTFLLKYLSELALSQNYIVATVPIHSGFGFSKFEDIYGNVMGHLASRFDEGGGSSFEGIFDHWLKELRRKGDMPRATQEIYRVITELNAYNSSFSNVLLAYIRAKINHEFDTANIAAAWIKGDRNMSFQLKKKLNVKGSIDRENAMDIFRGFVRLIHAMGYKGIIIVFDEAELIMHQRVDIRLKAYGNIRQLMDSSGAGEMDYCGFVFAGTPELFDDEEKGIPSYQALHQRIGEPMGDSRGISNLRQPVIPLNGFSKEDFGELCRKVTLLHQKVRDYQLDIGRDYLVNLVLLETSSKAAPDGVTVRGFLKKLIELLDLFCDNPDLPVFKALKNRS